MGPRAGQKPGDQYSMSIQESRIYKSEKHVYPGEGYGSSAGPPPNRDWRKRMAAVNADKVRNPGGK